MKQMNGKHMINETNEWKALEQHVPAIQKQHLRDLLQQKERSDAMHAEHNGIFLDYSRQNATLQTVDLLYNLADSAKLKQKIAAMANGEHINSTEDRAVMHMTLRAPSNKAMYVDGENAVESVHKVLNTIKKFSNQIRSGEKNGATGKKLVNVISIGIGGSYLGPEFVFEALRHEHNAKAAAQGRTLRFLANVDPVDVARAVEGLYPEETLVIVVSKTFTTAETMLNARTLRNWLIDGLAGKGVSATDAIFKHMIAVSAAVPKAKEFGIDEHNVFGFWDWVGGRYSVCSAVGVVPLALQYGFDITEKFLAGAHDMDTHFQTAPLRSNLPVLMGLFGIWNSSFLKHSSRALLPYSQALLRFSAHIQQVDMESNGKRVNIEGVELPFASGEVNFGEPGTNGQHSFYQLIHQGQVIPCDFIGFCESQNPISLNNEPVSNHDELMSNFFAQPDALAKGKSTSDLEAEKVPPHLIPHKVFSGNRPSISLLINKLDAFSCGQILALYEHRTVVQGAIWGLNSFDQWGVELGKVLATQVRKQLSTSRKLKKDAKDLDIEGFNSSTTNLLSRYLKYNPK